MHISPYPPTCVRVIGSQISMSEGGGIDKPLLAFLNGLSKRLYFSELDITDEFLRNEVLGGISNEGALYLERLEALDCGSKDCSF